MSLSLSFLSSLLCLPATLADPPCQILTLYAQRPIVEKQAKYAFYHPIAEAIGTYIHACPPPAVSWHMQKFTSQVRSLH